jgi:hypothetical protein
VETSRERERERNIETRDLGKEKGIWRKEIKAKEITSPHLLRGPIIGDNHN